MFPKIYFLIFILLIPSLLLAKNVETFSPDKKILVRATVSEKVSLLVFYEEKQLFEIHDIRMETDQGDIPAANPHIQKIKTQTVNRMVVPVIKEKQASIPENYNETTIEFRGKSKLVIRAYNEGIAYRLVSALPGEITVRDEHAGFICDEKALLAFQFNKDPNSDYEAPYIQKKNC